MRRSSLIVLIVSLVSSSAWADDFKAYNEQDPVTGDELGVYLWAKTGACSDARDEADGLACQEVARTLTNRAANRVFFWRSTESVVSAGQYDPKRKSMPIIVESCLACGGIDVGGDKLVVVGRTSKSDSPEPLRSTSMVFSTAKKAEDWEKSSLPMMTGEYLFRLPLQAERVKVGDLDGIYVDVSAYRVYDRCTGEVAVSRPKANPVPVSPGKECQKSEEPADSDSDSDSDSDD